MSVMGASWVRDGCVVVCGRDGVCDEVVADVKRGRDMGVVVDGLMGTWWGPVQDYSVVP